MEYNKSNFYELKYSIIRSKMLLGRFDVIVSLITFICAAISWYILEFKKTNEYIK